jgi:V/A-type H+-transporting ATPase subunit K
MWPAVLGAGIIGGIAMGMSAWYQGKAGASGSDALAETGQGFGNYLTTLGMSAPHAKRPSAYADGRFLFMVWFPAFRRFVRNAA